MHPNIGMALTSEQVEILKQSLLLFSILHTDNKPERSEIARALSEYLDEQRNSTVCVLEDTVIEVNVEYSLDVFDHTHTR